MSWFTDERQLRSLGMDAEVSVVPHPHESAGQGAEILDKRDDLHPCLNADHARFVLAEIRWRIGVRPNDLTTGPTRHWEGVGSEEEAARLREVADRYVSRCFGVT